MNGIGRKWEGLRKYILLPSEDGCERDTRQGFAKGTFWTQTLRCFGFCVLQKTQKTSVHPLYHHSSISLGIEKQINSTYVDILFE